MSQHDNIIKYLDEDLEQSQFMDFMEVLNYDKEYQGSLIKFNKRYKIFIFRLKCQYIFKYDINI